MNLTENWDLTQLYATEKAVLEEFQKIKALYQGLSKFEGKLNRKEVVLEYFEYKAELAKIKEKFDCYLFLRMSLNGKDTFPRTINAELSYFLQDITPMTVRLAYEIKSNSNKKLNEWKNDILFKDYDLLLEDIIKDKKHDLPKNTETILSLNPTYGGFNDAFESFDDIDLKFGKIKTSEGVKELTHATYSIFMNDKDARVRKQAYNKMHKAFANFNYTLGSLYLSNAEQTLYFSKIYKYKSVLESVCKNDKTDIKVLPTLIQTVRENLHHFYRFEELKKNYLKMTDFYCYDNYLDIGKLDQKFTYEQGTKIVLKALEVLGEDYISILKSALTDGWIDVYEKPAKTSGGFNLGVYGVHPFILLNWTDEYESVSTLAHELGHSMHSYYSDRSQPITKSSYSIFAAEVASIVNEILLVNYMIENSKSKQEKLYYVNTLLQQFYTTLYRQTMFSEFEYFVYQTLESKKPLIVEDLNKKYESLQKDYFGKDVKRTKYSKFEWSRIPHFYREYYVYKYSTGFISACIIAQNIMDRKVGYLEKYKAFLSAGESINPIELLKTVDVDITNKNTLENAFKLYEGLIDQFEELTKE